MITRVTPATGTPMRNHIRRRWRLIGVPPISTTSSVDIMSFAVSAPNVGLGGGVVQLSLASAGHSAC